MTPWHAILRKQIVDLALFVAVDDGGERVCQPCMGVDCIHLAGLDLRGDDRPVFRASFMARK
jgi:hypothetical protein